MLREGYLDEECGRETRARWKQPCVKILYKNEGRRNITWTGPIWNNIKITMIKGRNLS